MNKFKAGDTVVCTKSYSNHVICGKEYTVLGVSGKYLEIEVKGKVGGYNCNRFKLKETKEKKRMTKEIKVGDTVRLISNVLFSEHKVGDVGTVVKKHPYLGETWLIEVDDYSSEGATWSKTEDLEVVTTAGEDFLKSLSRAELKAILKTAQYILDTEEVTLYSVTGSKWGQKRIPESKLKLSYTLRCGKVEGTPKVEDL